MEMNFPMPGVARVRPCVARRRRRLPGDRLDRHGSEREIADPRKQYDRDDDGGSAQHPTKLSPAPIHGKRAIARHPCLNRRMPSRAMKMLLVDDHALFREGLKLLLRSLGGELEIDEAGDCPQALEKMSGQGYDLVLLDLNMPGRGGLDALSALREAAPSTPVVVLSGEEDPHLVRGAIDRGAMGFIPKSSTPEILIPALKLALAGGVYLPPAVLDTRADAPQSAPAQSKPQETSPAGLTQRQMDVLR